MFMSGYFFERAVCNQSLKSVGSFERGCYFAEGRYL
jgi:hypothetical protein